MAPEVVRMASWLREWYPEVGHLLDRPNRIRAIFRDKWPVITSYMRHSHFNKASSREPVPWEEFKQAQVRRHLKPGA